MSEPTINELYTSTTNIAQRNKPYVKKMKLVTDAIRFKPTGEERHYLSAEMARIYSILLVNFVFAAILGFAGYTLANIGMTADYPTWTPWHDVIPISIAIMCFFFFYCSKIFNKLWLGIIGFYLMDFAAVIFITHMNETGGGFWRFFVISVSFISVFALYILINILGSLLRLDTTSTPYLMGIFVITLIVVFHVFIKFSYDVPINAPMFILVALFTVLIAGYNNLLIKIEFIFHLRNKGKKDSLHYTNQGLINYYLNILNLIVDPLIHLSKSPDDNSEPIK